MKERECDEKLLRKYEDTELTFDDDQSKEMTQIVNIINKMYIWWSSRPGVQGSQGTHWGEWDWKVWRSDIHSDKEEFNKDQATYGMKLICTCKCKHVLSHEYMEGTSWTSTHIIYIM